MSTTPTIGSGTWVEPSRPKPENLTIALDYFQAQTIVREQNVEELTRVCNVLRDTKTKFESNELDSAGVLAILAEFKSEEFKVAHPDEIMQTTLWDVFEKFEQAVGAR